MPTHKSFHYYGGRRITVCERWHRFENFLTDMGFKPAPKMTLERVNNELGYSPENCKWATWKEQAKNKRSHGWNKLTEADAVMIRADPRKYYEIAKDYNVTRPMIGYIKQGKSFAHVGGVLVTRLAGVTKLNPQQVHAIRSDPRRHWEIAKDYSMSRSAISAVKRKK
jgi:hypothetical protein